MEKIVIWYSIQNGGDGSAQLAWYLTKETVVADQEGEEDFDDNEADYYEPQWSEPCYGSVETFVGSDIHKKAVANDGAGS